MIIQLLMKITSPAIRHPPSSSPLSLFSIFVIYFPLNRHSSCALFFYHQVLLYRQNPPSYPRRYAVTTKHWPFFMSCLLAKLIVAFFSFLSFLQCCLGCGPLPLPGYRKRWHIVRKGNCRTLDAEINSVFQTANTNNLGLAFHRRRWKLLNCIFPF